MTQRRTGRYVRLELVWRGGILLCGSMGSVGDIHEWQNGTGWGWWTRDDLGERHYHGDLPTRAEAERAVEDAVIARMGGGA